MQNKFVMVLLTHELSVTKMSDNIAFAKDAAPSDPSSGASRVLLIPGVGHFAKTTTAPPKTHVVESPLFSSITMVLFV